MVNTRHKGSFMNHRHVVVALALFSGLGIACVNLRQSLMPRASAELGCDVKEAEITEIESGQFLVQACGCRAMYLSYPSWTLNSVSGEHCSAASPR